MKRKYILWMLLAFSLKLYSFEAVYITGSAFGGWTNDKPEVMTPLAEEGIFEWSGTLSAGEFKFLLRLNSWTNCLNAKTDKEVVVLGKLHEIVHVPNYYETGGDYPFVIEQSGPYRILVDTKAMTMQVEEAQVEVPELWVTGSALSGSFDKLIPDPSGVAGKYRYWGKLKSGELKILNSSSITSETVYYQPVGEDVDIYGEAAIKETPDGDAHGFTVVVPDNYLLYIDVSTKKARGLMFSRENLYIVGGATAAGWDCFAAIPLSKSETEPVYTYQGVLSIRESGEEPNLFKFLCQKNWGPNSYHPLTRDELILNSSEIVLNSSQDSKWAIAADQQGYYTIKINVFDETINAVFHGDNPPSGIQDMQSSGYTICQSGKSVRIEAEDDLSTSTALLYNASGKLVAKEVGVDGSFLLGDNLEPGVYILQLLSEKQMFTEKTIIR